MRAARMCDDAETCCVGGDCRAHDLRKLRIVRSSTFPTGGAMNPTLTIAALALRVAASMAASM